MNPSNRHSRESGAVLVIVAFFVVVLSILVLQFGYLARLDARMAANFRDATEAAALARAGVAQAIALLQEDALEDEKGEEETEEASAAQPRRGRRQEETAGQGQDQESEGHDDLSEAWAVARAPVKLAGGEFVFSIVDEDRKFNVNLVAEEAVAEVEELRQEPEKKEEETEKKEGEEKDGAQETKAEEKKTADEAAKEGEEEEEEVEETKIDEEVRDQLIVLLDELDLSASKDLAKNIIDWIDIDDDGDAEDKSYSLLEPSYRCRNAPLESIGELALIKDIGPKMLDGERLREEIPETKEGEEKPSPRADDDAFAGLRRYLTVYSDGLINVNTAPEEVLRAWLGEDQADLAADIVSAREKEPFAKMDEIKEAIGEDIPSKVLEKMKVKSAYFTILAEGRSGGVAVRLRAVVQRLPDEVRIIYWRYES